MGRYTWKTFTCKRCGRTFKCMGNRKLTYCSKNDGKGGCIGNAIKPMPWELSQPLPNQIAERQTPAALEERRERVEELATSGDTVTKRVGYCEVCNREMIYYSTLTRVTCSPECESQLLSIAARRV